MKTPQAPENVGINTWSACNATLVAWRFPRSLKSANLGNILMAQLFFLIAGFAQLPAAAIYTPVSFSHSVGTGDLGPGTTIFTADLPGSNDLIVNAYSYGGIVPLSNFYQLFCLNSGGYIATDLSESLYYAHSIYVSETWVDTSNGRNSGANISRMPQTGNPGILLRSNPTYIPFYFTDTTDLSTKFGYITLATSVTGSGASAQFNLDVFGYAYDNSGAKIAMGAVPEPSTVLSAALGILGIAAVLHCKRTKTAWKKEVHPPGLEPGTN